MVTIGVLVIVHEFGHYFVARLFGVKVLTFAIGFGPKLLTVKGKHNDWSIGCIPLGGYVRMLDERESDVPVELQSQAFNNKPPYQKILIAGAGPLFNFIFAVLVYYILAIYGVSALKPVIASVNPKLAVINKIELPANAIINSINGKKVLTWYDADTLFNQAIKKSGVVNLDYTESTNKTYSVTLDIIKAKQHFNNNVYFETLGVYPFSYLSKIAYIEPKSKAEQAGLRVNDEIIAINGLKTHNWFIISEIIKNSPQKNIDLLILRNNVEHLIKVRPEFINYDGEDIGKLGIMPSLDENQIEKNSFIKKYGYIDSINYAFQSCYSIIVLNLSVLKSMVEGKMSVKNLGGPIAIATAGSKAMHDGFKRFVDFLALMSIGLGVMNLLPIPVLDGGHVVIYAVEWIIGREVPHNVQMLIFKVGFILILGISALVIFNDILRL